MDHLKNGGVGRKVFIERDYSHGTLVQFSKTRPPELDSRIDQTTFENAILQINEIFLEAESMSARACMESCCACMTAYLLYLCMDTFYEKSLKRVSRLVHSLNMSVFIPRGLLMVDPSKRGLRVIEISFIGDDSNCR